MATSQPLIPITTTTHFPTKLTSQNFPVWRRQVQSTLIGLGLDNFITDGNVPSKTIADKEVTKPNPEYTVWYRQDQILFSAILRSCSNEIQPVIASASTAKEAWDRLTSNFASKSRSRIISLKSKLAKNPKGNRSVAVFLNEMRSIADELALVQSPIHEEDLLVHILTQLGEEYNSITAALKVREQPISYPKLFDKLVDFERSLKEAEPTAPLIITANASQRQTGRSQFRSASDQSTRNQRSYSESSQRPYRMTNNSPTNYSRPNRSNQFCNFCNIQGHDTRDCRKLVKFLKDHHITFNNNSPAPPVANVVSSASQPYPLPQQWMMDSGASHHLTSCPSTLTSVSEYGGPDEIILGDGSQNGGASHARGEHP